METPTNTNGFVIEKNVPMPKRSVRYPFATMEIGDSFLLNTTSAVEAQRARCAASRENGQFKIRKSPEGYRCWRAA